MVGDACYSVETEIDPVLRRMAVSRLWVCRGRLPGGLTSRLDALLADTVPLLSAGADGASPPGVLAVPRRHFLNETAST